MKTITTLAAAVTLALSTQAMAQTNMDMHVAAKGEHGKPTFVTGKLGMTTSDATVSALKSFVSEQSQYGAKGNEDFVISQQWTDKLGKMHTRVNQTINGLKVYGTDMIVHANVVDNGLMLRGLPAQAEIYAVSGKLATADSHLAKRSIKQDNISKFKAIKVATKVGELEGQPELSYIHLPLKGETRLAWRIEVKWDKGSNNFGHDELFVDYADSKELTRQPFMHTAKSWRTYDLNNGDIPQAPGTLLCTNNQSCGDASAQRAHDGASKVYDYYKARFGRNSIDNNDMTMVSSVHTQTNYNNAFWYNGQMYYGDGDGVKFTDLTKGFDVIGHEMTHGIIERTANLAYRNASGALNEGFADIFGAAAQAYKEGSSTADWKLGEGVTLQTSALRYMNNPTQDGYSTDWYPDRIPFVSNPTRNNDYGGVHGNSGIANLAFVLLTDGGTHPRGKSSTNVPGIGLAKSEQIFYRALTTYMGASTDFAGARTATAQAAADLYGNTEKTAVETAWCAVGVGSCPGSSGGGVDPISGSVSNVSVGYRSWKRYTQTIGSGYSTMTITTSGGSGDSDLYVRFGSQPTTSSYNCRSWRDGNNETCTISNPAAGTWYIGLYGYRAASGLTLSLTAQ